MAFKDNVDKLQKNGVFGKVLTDAQKEILNDLSKAEVDFMIRIKKQIGGPQPFTPSPNGVIY